MSIESERNFWAVYFREKKAGFVFAVVVWLAILASVTVFPDAAASSGKTRQLWFLIVIYWPVFFWWEHRKFRKQRDRISDEIEQ